MTKKTTTICCTLALLATTTATPALSQTKNFEGAMIGLGISQVAGSTDTTLSTALPAKINYQNNDYSTIPFIDLSYSIPISNNFLIRLGGKYDFSKTKSGSVSSDITYAVDTIVLDGVLLNAEGTVQEKINLNYNYKDHHSIYLAPTVVVSANTAIFGKLGYHKQKGTLKYSENYTFEDTATDEAAWLADDNSLSYSASRSKNFEGWGYGLGFVHTFGNAYIQLDAEYIDYKKFSFTDSSVSEPITYSFKPESLNAAISVGYRF